ncbi:uncharacterized protein CTRU02_211229 [Colletotrichum truncatum]|uniref:Uncharacterized protein n=1 Tax=Colletotrichum truncatum TaxID=5467 RepID=A0ACC3YR87_COLTU|nr:uncharacterized protein CTRU02_02010 [Colletotrichum truncatum]KAF6799139.1 hypothetical protein CTRU02_02010 [Colletotrichum truncatum]
MKPCDKSFLCPDAKDVDGIETAEPLLAPFNAELDCSASKPAGKMLNLKDRSNLSLAKITWRFILWTFIFGFALWGASDAAVRTFKGFRAHQATHCHCGVTTADGIAQGCIFDELELGWMKPECVDHDLTDEFARSGPGIGGAWYYETEVDGKPVHVNVTELSMMVEPGRIVRFTYEQHVTHCIFEWRKQFRRHFLGTTMSLRREMEGHIKHCGSMFLLNADRDELRTKLVYPNQIIG